jgi:hypothetical protein
LETFRGSCLGFPRTETAGIEMDGVRWTTDSCGDRA